MTRVLITASAALLVFSNLAAASGHGLSSGASVSVSVDSGVSASASVGSSSASTSVSAGTSGASASFGTGGGVGVGSDTCVSVGSGCAPAANNINQLSGDRAQLQRFMANMVGQPVFSADDGSVGTIERVVGFDGRQIAIVINLATVRDTLNLNALRVGYKVTPDASWSERISIRATQAEFRRAVNAM